MQIDKEFFLRLTASERNQLIRDAERAERALVERGWTQHTLEDETGAVCALGAEYVAVYGKVDPKRKNQTLAKKRRVDRLTEAVERVLHTRGHIGSIPTYNDKRYRQRRHITSLFQQVRKYAKIN